MLFDNNISYRIVRKLTDVLAESLHVSRTGLPVPAEDRAIWEYARQNGYAVVTFDEDFAELESLYGFPPKVILLRFGNSSTDFVATTIRALLPSIQQFMNDEEQGIVEIF
jgi:predicted nuclease of predicted toxin-antitoxin system